MHTLLRRNREKSVARYPGKIRGGQVDFSKRSTLLFFDKICTNHICTSNSPQKNIKTEDNHENALQN